MGYSKTEGLAPRQIGVGGAHAGSRGPSKHAGVLPSERAISSLFPVGFLGRYKTQHKSSLTLSLCVPCPPARTHEALLQGMQNCPGADDESWVPSPALQFRQCHPLFLASTQPRWEFSLRLTQQVAVTEAEGEGLECLSSDYREPPVRG